MNVEIRDTTPIERDPERVQEILPWYLNGTLAESDRAWVEQMLAADEAGLQDQLEFDRRLARAFEEQLAQVPADVGWAGLIRKVRADAVQPGGSPARRDGAASGSWLQRLGRLLAPVMSPQVGMALAVLVAVQTIAIGVLVGERGDAGGDTVEYRSAGDARPVTAIRALLNDSVTEKVLRAALTENGATIVDGPNPLGEYWIVTDARDPEVVARWLRDAGVIASYVIDQRQQGR